MKTIVFSKDVSCFEQRIYSLEKYLRLNKYNYNLRLYIAGFFPIIEIPDLETIKILSYSINRPVSKDRVREDTAYLRFLKQRLNNNYLILVPNFLIAFRVPKSSLRIENLGHQYKSETLDSMIKLYIYIPYTRDRIYSEIRIPPQEYRGLIGCLSGRYWISKVLTIYFKIYTGNYKLPRLKYIDRSGI